MITSPISRPITSRIASAIAGAVAAAGRWYLHWGGVNERAEMSEWSASGFGDSISETLVAADPGNGDQYLWSSSDGLFALYIANTTAALTLKYTDIDGSTARSIVGPAIVAGAGTTYTVSLNADGVTLTVSGTDYDNANTPELGSVVYFSSDNTPANHFEGTYWDRRFTNATALQGVNAVQGNGVDLYGVIPEITLTGDFEIELDHISALYSAANYRIIGSNASNRMRYSTASSGQLAITISGVSGAIDDVLPSVAGEHGRLIISRAAGQVSASWCGVPGNNTLSIPGDFVISKIYTADSVPLPAGAVLGNVKITDKSGAEDVVYEYDLSGDDGSDIPITIDGVASTPGTWQNYDSGTDQVALPVLSRNYRMNDGPDALFLEDANHPLGPELVTNGGFDVAANWSEIAGGSSNTISGGQLTSVISASFRGAYQPLALAAGTYVISFDLVANSAGTVQFVGKTVADGISGTTVFQLDAITPGTYSAVVTIVGGVNSIAVRNSASSATFTIDNVSVRCIETGAILYNVSESDWDRSKT